MNDQIKREENVHGTHWGALHGGYFSDPVVAAPLVRKVKALADALGADTIVDLGGGIGSVLSFLLAEGVARGVSLVNLDDSDAQLACATRAGVSCVRGSVDSFTRRDVGAEEGRFLFMMRSVLHYFGEEGLLPVLRHVRTQARAGEFFVHQSASFRRQKDADCLNELYKSMRTQKWYPTVDVLCERLKAEGWEVREVLPATPLPLRDVELMQRYHLSQAERVCISEQLSQNHQVSEDVFNKNGDGFCAFLHYWIYVCTPAMLNEAEKNT